MRMPPVRSMFALKLLVALLALSTLAAVVGSHLAPSLPLLAVLLYAAVGAAALIALVLVAVFCRIWIKRVMLVRGRDPEWSWKPPGLAELREGASSDAARDRRRV